MVTTPARTAHKRRYLMCKPEYFTVSYKINPWMEPTTPTDTAKAVAQWQKLYDAYIEHGHTVELIEQLPDFPDMVYTANGGFVIDGVAYPPKFYYKERQGEEPAFEQWFRDNGFDVVVPEEVQEGEGDFLLAGDIILAGTGFRSTGDSHGEVGRIFNKEVVTLELVDPRFYHLDTALTILDPVVEPGQKPMIAYLPHAFDEESQAKLETLFPDAIKVSDADGAVFGLNSASDGLNVFLSPRATGFIEQLKECGYNPVTVDLSELLLGGGGIKCCTLELRGASDTSEG